MPVGTPVNVIIFPVTCHSSSLLVAYANAMRQMIIAVIKNPKVAMSKNLQ
jgi:hypothetical protein